MGKFYLVNPSKLAKTEKLIGVLRLNKTNIQFKFLTLPLARHNARRVMFKVQFD